jgi:hypothetical protein
METPNTASMSKEWKQQGASDDEIKRVFRTFNAWADSFREESEKHDK